MIKLDIGCGENKNRGYVGMDRRALPGVDIIHDLEALPYPLDDECCEEIMASHIIEHIKPWIFIDVMDELWRLLIPEGRLVLMHPYGINSRFVQDPTHCNPINEVTYQYFDPKHPLYTVYRPRPWMIEPGFPKWKVDGDMTCVLRKRDSRW
jgi:hypothetical protein